MRLNREPALWAAALAVIAQGVILLVWGREVDTSSWVPWLTMAVTFVAGLVTRQKVIPVATVKDAGVSPAALKQQAANPTVAPHEGV